MPGVSLRCTRAQISAPWVTSGSSPASFTTQHEAACASSTRSIGVMVAVSPIGKLIVTCSGQAPVSSASVAALAAAAALLPVV